MNKVSVNTFVDITVEDIAKSITPEELGDLFCQIAGAVSIENRSSNQRRVLIGQIADGLHEKAIQMLGEVLALAYHRVKNSTFTVAFNP